MAERGIFVFEADNADFKNRKRAAKACASCQKRKKRCSHTFTKSTDQQAEKDSAEKVLPQLSHKEPVKFVGDLNPESVLTELTQRSKDSPRYSRIGVWVEQSRLEQEQYRRQQEAAARNGNSGETEAGLKKQAAVQRYSKIERGRRTLTGHQKNYLQAVGALRVLPKATQDALITTYVACIDPLLPVIDCKKLLQDYTNAEASVFLVQAICLVTCKTQEAIPYLRLYEDGPLMDAIPFARALHTGLDAAMKADLEADRFTKVQIMTLMSLHNDGPGGIEESSLHLTMAIHDAQTTGLHINTPGRSSNDQPAMLWWTLWTLDKFNACLGGRPLMIADRDIDIKRPSLEQNVRSQTMAVWLAMGELLDEVIEFYRPGVDPETAGWENDFPSFEKLTENCSMDILGPSQRNLLEICYNIIGILSCRAGGPMSRSYNRRIESADRIQKLTAEGRFAHLPPLPLVPYAISLSLTVAYRGLRDSHSDPVKTQSDLAARCGILESLNKTWWTADAMAKLGRKALKSLQQPAQADGQRKSTTELNVGDALEAEVAPCKYGPFNSKSDDVGDALEAEVAPCKFGPFNGKARNSRGNTSPGTANGPSNAGAPLARTSSGESNGLQVLSQAAATLGKPKQSGDNMDLSNLRINGSHTSNSRRTNQTSNPNKRPRYNSDHAPARSNISDSTFSPNGNHLMVSTPSATTRMSTMSNTPAQTPLQDTTPTMTLNNQTMKLNHNPSTGVFEINPIHDPFCATYDLDPNSATTDLSTAANLDSNMATTSSAAAQHPQMYNPRMSVPLHGNQNIDIDMYNYNDLDNLFDGFFDLSMPTMFQDPLFEGAEYDQFSFNFLTGGASGGPSGAGSVDMGYMQGVQQPSTATQGGQAAGNGNGWHGNRNMGMNMNMHGNGNMNTNEVSENV
ncbi:hypothetical protein PMZ80_000727 [Knufia obscura]|uniref:Xylanolytic transcriptional activator regulatory domain-containing protein n=1 Tax=Knufia obscura TaxID=1635080 RepID=A0ABR0S2J6_9EURO|nr:hypothetical protein PMZ80_000727 [Knufia obscura]